MTEPEHSSTRAEEDAFKQGRSIVYLSLKATGAGFMLAAPVIGFNLGGAAEAIGIGEGDIQKIIGCASFVIGFLDFFVIPKIILKKR